MRSTLILLLVAAFVVVILMSWKYGELQAEVREACATTGAAAKLDLSSFVPLCKEIN